MDLLDRMLAHDSWTTRQLLLACASLPDSLLDKEFDIDHKTLRGTFTHMIANMEVWTDLLYKRPVQHKTGDAVPELLARLSTVAAILPTWRARSLVKGATMIALWIHSTIHRTKRRLAAQSGTCSRTICTIAPR